MSHSYTLLSTKTGKHYLGFYLYPSLKYCDQECDKVVFNQELWDLDFSTGTAGSINVVIVKAMWIGV